MLDKDSGATFGFMMEVLRRTGIFLLFLAAGWGANAQMSGTYTVDPTGSGSTNFTTLQAAVTALTTQGVSAPVSILLAPGTSHPSVSIGSIAGTGPTKRVRFLLDTLKGVAPAQITTSGVPLYALQLSGVRYVDFRNLVIQSTGTIPTHRVVELLGGTSAATSTGFVRFSKCILSAPALTVSSTNAAVVFATIPGFLRSISFYDVQVSGSSMGIYIPFSTSAASVPRNIQVQKCRFVNQSLSGSWFYSTDSLLFEDNTIRTTSNSAASQRGLMLQGSTTTPSGWAVIRRNKIRVIGSNGGYGIMLSTFGTATSPIVTIENNAIHIPNGAGSNVGMYAFNTRRVHFFHNSVRIDKGLGSSTASAIFSVVGLPANVSQIQYRNNLGVSYGGSVAVAVTVTGATASNVFSSMSHNVHYAPHSGTSFRFNGTNYTTLSAWQTATGLDANSVFADPLMSESTLRTWSSVPNGIAVPVGTFVDFEQQPRSGTAPDIGADEFGSATCSTPSLPTLTYARMQSLGLQWTSPNASPVQRQIRYSRALAQATYWTKNNAQLTDSITGLQPLTDYLVWVRDICAPGDTGLWVGPLLATTASVPCAILTAPYLEDFESLNWFPSPNNQAVGILDPCWSQGDTSTFYWRVNGSATSTSFTGPAFDNSSTGTRYLHTESRNGGNGLTTSILTPWISMNTLLTAQLKFASHRYGSAISGLQVQAQRFPNGPWINVTTLSGFLQTSKSDPWTEHTVSMNAFAGDTIRLRFTGTKTFASSPVSDMAIDDIRLDSVRTCLPPNTPTLGTATTSSISIAWTQLGASGWQVQYGTSGFALGSGLIRSAPTAAFTATGLSPATAYDFYVRDSCGPTNYSVWTKVFTATTLCGVVQTPWSENFDNGSFLRPTAFNQPGVISNCWSRTPTATGYQWNPAPPFQNNQLTGPIGDHTGGGKFMSAYNTAFNPANLTTNLRTPALSLAGLTQPELTFWVHGFGQDLANLEVQVKETKAAVTTWTTVLLLSGQQNASQSSPWSEYNIPLTAWIGDTVFVRFIAGRNTQTSTFAQWALDDIAVKQAPPCPKPQQVSVVGTTSNTATLSWVAGGSAPWVVRYGLLGIPPTGGTRVVANSNPFVLGGLNPSTTYSVYVKDSCSGSVSQWVGPLQFTTDCAPIGTPFFEDFDGTDFAVGIGIAPGTVAPCWNRSTVQGYYMTPGPQGFPNTLTGPSADHTTGTGKYLVSVVTSTLGATLFADVVTPALSTVPLDTPEVSFWYHMYGADITGLTLEVFNGLQWSQVWSATGQQQNANSDPWLKAIVSLAAFQDDTIKLRFVASRQAIPAFNAQVAIDDLDIHEQPSCPQASSLTTTASTTTSVTINWLGTAGNYQVSYGPIGHTPGSASTVTTSVRPYTITGLSPSTSYSVFVRRICGSTFSNWEGPLVVTTACGTVQAPWAESFDGPQWIPTTGFSNQPGKMAPCWTRTDTTNYFFTPWVGLTVPAQSGPASGATGPAGKFMYAAVPFGLGGNFTRIITPWINLTPLNVGELSFFSHRFGNNIVSLVVEATTNGVTWTPILTLTGASQTSKAAPWTEHLVSLAGYNNATIKLRFTATRTANGFNSAVAIDQIDIHETPLCPKPTAMALTATGPTTVSVNWTGTATSGVIEYGPKGFARGTGTRVYAPTKPHIVTGLTAFTTYDFYVKDSCGPVTGASSWYGPDSLSMPGCTNGCNYTLTLTDQFSDGWSTSFNAPPYHFVTLVTGARTKTYTLTSGGNQVFTIPVCPGQNLSLAFTNVGAFSNECGIVLRNSSNAVVYQRTAGTNIPTGNLFSGTSTCSTCPPPTNGAITAVSSTQASVVFTKNAAFADVAIGFPGFQPSLTTKIANVNSPHVFTGLTASTTYHVFYRDSCGTGGNVSAWIGPLVFTTTNCPPVASVATLISRVGNTIQVSATGSTPGVTYTWSWGDATPNNTGLTATHTYGSSGTFVVTLTVSNACGSTSTSQIIVPICSSITANFYTLGTGLARSFISNGTGQPTQYKWIWGDGTPNGSGSPAPHAYAVDGAYYVRLIVKNACGDSAVFGDTVYACAPVTSSFTFTTNGSIFNGQATSSANAVSWKWYFGDGNTAMGNSPSHTYTNSGSFTVRMVSYNLCGDSSQFTATVNVCVTPVARFTATILSSSGSGMRVLFDATSSIGASQYRWFFGDGSTAVGTNFTQHTYSVPSLSYVVTLIVENACGDDDTLSFRLSQIGQEEIPEIPLTLYPNPAYAGNLVYGFVPNGQSENVQLISLNGSRVIALEWGSEPHSVQLPAHLSPGSYCLLWMGEVYRLIVLAE